MKEPESSVGLHRFAMFAVAATFCLIFIGGLVTSTGSALAVPDWPLAFGKLIPAWEGGIRFEFGHRVAAGFVTMVTLALMIGTIWVERRKWVRNLAMAAFGLIIVQAILGGITVLFELPLAIAVTHAATAQAFFCVIVSLAIFTNPNWSADSLWSAGLRAGETRGIFPARTNGIPLTTLTAYTTAVIYLQILIGALMRHLGAGLAIPDFPLMFGQVLPPYWNEFIAVNFAHRMGAVLVTVMILWTATRVLREHGEDAMLRRPALEMIALLTLQICLGALTIWTGRSVLPTTAHVAIGAAVLATSLTLTIRTYRLLGWPHARKIAHAADAGIVAHRASA